MDFVIHDLKADRPNISGGLPGVYRLVPVAFYAGAVLALLMNAFYFVSFRNHQQSERRWQKEVTDAQMEQTNIVHQQSALSAQAIAAGRIADWLDGARPVQPIATAVVRSMEAKATIADLTLDRNPRMPSHLVMDLKVNHAGTEQIEATLQSLAAIDYKNFYTNQALGENAIDFKATLIWSQD